MADHEDHGPVATHPLLLAVAGVAFAVLMILGIQLWSSAGHSAESSHETKSSSTH